MALHPVTQAQARQQHSGRWLQAYLCLAIPLAWAFWLPMVAIARGWLRLPVPLIVLSTLGACSPLFSLLIVERMSSGLVSVKSIYTRIAPRDLRARWVAWAVVVPFGAALVGAVATSARATGSQLQILNEGPAALGWGLAAIIPVHFATALFTSPLLEEPAWRGFALPALRAKLPRWAASLFLGTYWWLWHQGMNLAFELQPSLVGYVGMVALSFAIDAMTELSGGNLLVPMLAHQASGTAIIFIRGATGNWYANAALILAALVLHTHARPAPGVTATWLRRGA